MSRQSRAQDRGFTLVEMVVVLAIILIMLGVAMPIYSHSIVEAREENLRTNLNTLNFMIFQYTQDKQKPPQSLEDLKSAGYIQAIPDDITGTPDWTPEEGDGAIMSLYQTDTSGIIGVHSSSNQISSDGTAYSTW
jgi:general secretion pathway protein G